MPRSITVLKIAKEHNLDLDEVLVTLWDAEIDIEDIDSNIAQRDLPYILKALDISNPKQEQLVDFWREKLAISRTEFEQLLESIGVKLSPTARKLPKGCLSKLRRYIAKRHLPDMTRASNTTTQSTIEPRAEEPPLEWKVPGLCRAIKYLESEEIRSIHERLEVDFATTNDPINPPGVRDLGLLESSANRPLTSLSGQLKYPTLESATSALLHSVIHNHAFYNGNKRTAVVSALVMLDRNNFLLTCTQQELFKFTLRVAQHSLVPRQFSQRADREVMEIANWIFRNSRSIQRAERAIKWLELRRILTKYDCTFSAPLPGNKIKIQRTLPRHGFLKLASGETLNVNAWYGGEGREVGQDHVHHLRKQLRLSEEDGVDSDYFYGKDPREPDEFITQYRNLLRRLARL